MALKDNFKFTLKKIKIKESFENIMKDNKMNLLSKKKEIDNLLKDDNTIEEIDFEYLKLKNKILGSSNNDMLEELSKYECCIEENKINNEFPIIKKIAYKTKTFDLISLLKEYINNKELISIVDTMDKIMSKKPKKFHNYAPINYNENLELYYYSLFYNFYKNILNSYENNFIIDNENYKNNYMKLTIEQSKAAYLGEKDTEIIDKELKYLPYIYGTFDNFLINLSLFLSETYNNFCKRFLNKEMIEEDLLLFGDYLFFLSNYEFSDSGENYQEIWNCTFEDISIEKKIELVELKNKSTRNTFRIENNTLYIKNKINQYSISNINNYCFEPLIRHLVNLYKQINFLELNKFLKIDKYMKELYIKKIWNVWEKFIIRIFTSKISQSLFEKVFNNIDSSKKLDPYNFINGKEIKLIINNIRYFIFHTDFHGLLTEGNLALYFNGDSYLVENDELLSKIFYLTENVKNNIHEIIGHMNIRFQYYLSKDKRYSSPKPEKPSKFAEQRNGKEAGEFVEELLFGAMEDEIELTQMLYILDIKNYDKEIDDFRKEYISYKDTKIYPISPDFKDFLKQLGIDSEKINFKETKRLCIIHKHKNINQNTKYGRHPINYKGYDDIYDSNK